MKLSQARLSIHTPNPVNGFALIELLIVLGIVIILCGLAFPVLHNVMGKARQAQCASNLRQIGLASQAWSADNDGKIVPVYYPNDEVGMSKNHWTGLLAPYMGRTKTGSFESASEMPVYCCPEMPGRFGYGYNYYYLSWIEVPKNRYQWVKYAQVSNPSQIVMLADEYTASNLSTWKCYLRPPTWGLNDAVVHFRHPGRTANVLWVDGHVSAEEEGGPLTANDYLWQAQK